MATKIDKKILGYQVAKPDQPVPPTESPKPAEVSTAEVIQMHEKLERPEVLIGSTYKIKTPLFDHALYVTINDIVLNSGTKHELRRPFEIFINSKSMDHFQWTVALTRIMSSVFRKGGDITFIVEELKAIFDPRGGYYKPGGVFMPSLIAELGAVVEKHLKSIGLLGSPVLSEAQLQLMAEKRAAYEAANSRKEQPVEPIENSASFPPTAQLCGKCSTKALVLMDGCQTCLNCGYSKCG